jgi:hypothetical protein
VTILELDGWIAGLVPTNVNVCTCLAGAKLDPEERTNHDCGVLVEGEIVKIYGMIDKGVSAGGTPTYSNVCTCLAGAKLDPEERSSHDCGVLVEGEIARESIRCDTR